MGTLSMSRSMAAVAVGAMLAWLLLVEASPSRAAPTGPGVVFSTYLGRYDPPRMFGWNGGYAVAVDDLGYVYVAGCAVDDLLLVPGALQAAPKSNGFDDAFVVKLSPDGQRVVYGTYLGGSRMDIATGVAVDRERNIVLVGLTESTDFPVHRAAQADLGGGFDAFVTRISAAGDRLISSTFLGGLAQDVAADVAVDAAGNAYVVGVTDSYDFPTLGAFQPSSPDRPISDDGFVARYSPAGDLVYSTLLGGSENDYALALAVRADGAAIVAGQTRSADFPLKRALQARPAEGPGALRGEAFLTELEPGGSDLAFSTYFGGQQEDMATSLALDGAGRPIMAGFTCSPDLPVRAPLQGAMRGQWDAFAARFAPDGSTLDRSTYLGGSGAGIEAAWGVAALPDGRVALLGETQSGDFPVREPVQPGLAGQRDLFVSVLAPSMSEMVFGTLLGGSDGDPARMGTSRSGLADLQLRPALAPARDGTLLLTADIRSPDFPMVNALAERFPGVLGAVVVKIGSVPPESPDPSACAFIARRVPPAVIADALANPERVPGWRELCNPAVPPSPLNYERTWLSLLSTPRPYHPIANTVVFKCGCP